MENSQPLYFTLGFDPYKANRVNRKIVQKELEYTLVLRGLLGTFPKAIDIPEADFEEIFDAYNSKWKKECHHINNIKKPKAFIANVDHFSNIFGYDKEKVNQYKNGISIIKHIQKLVWK